jgi:hypothetical protein
MYLEEKNEPTKTVYCPLLLEAADFLETHHWVRGEYQNAFGFCMLGACRNVILKGQSPYKSEVSSKQFEDWDITERHLFEYCYSKFNLPAIQWNDEVAKNKEEVIQTMRDAAYWENPNVY